MPWSDRSSLKSVDTVRPDLSDYYSNSVFQDFIRAGVTCYTYFYQQGAQSYIDLARKIQYLFTAQQHMQAYLDPAQWGNVQHPLTVPQRQVSWERGSKGDSVSVRLVKDAEEVKRYALKNL